MKIIPQHIKTKIVEYLKEGLSCRDVAKRVPSVSLMTVSRILNTETGLPRSRAGRPHKLSDHAKRKVIRDISSGKIENAVIAAHELSEVIRQTVHPENVRRVLRKAGLKSIKKKKKPFLSKKHRKQRLDFAQKYANWTVEDFKRVIWSDETKINRLGSDGLKWTWRKPQHAIQDYHVQGTFKHGGGSLMFWGCMTWNGAGQACKIEGTLDSTLYCEILSDNLLGTADYFQMDRDYFVFQQDNDPKHTSRLAKDWFNQNRVNLMDWPPQSPDMNPIEHLWHALKQRLQTYPEPPKGIHELWERLQDEWLKIPVETCQNLISSMLSRIQTLLKAKGGYTKY